MNLYDFGGMVCLYSDMTPWVLRDNVKDGSVHPQAFMIWILKLKDNIV